MKYTESTTRLLAALTDPNATFTRDQVAYLIAAAIRVHDAKPAEVHLDETYERGFNAGMEAADAALVRALKHGLGGDADLTWKDAVSRHERQVTALAARREADATARLPRIGDYRGLAA